VEAVSAWVEGDLPRAIALHEEQAREHPRDLASLKLGQYHLFNLGHSPGMLRIVQPALHAAAEVPYLHGMAAFAWEQCHLLEQAEAAARRALAIQPKEPWAQHALAHVMITQGRITEGRDFMDAVSGQWTDLNSFMVTHNWWHLALFELELDHAATVLDLYDRQVWGVVKAYSQDQIGAVSLLARLEIAGVDVGDRWQDVADHLEQRGTTTCSPSWTCNTSTGWPAPAAPAPARGWPVSKPLRPGRPPGRARPGSRSRCRRRAGCWPMRMATGVAPSKAWARRCRSCRPSAAAMRSATCSSSCTWTPCCAPANGAARSTCCSSARTAARSRCG
jgi:hypothetical protein